MNIFHKFVHVFLIKLLTFYDMYGIIYTTKEKQIEITTNKASDIQLNLLKVPATIFTNVYLFSLHDAISVRQQVKIRKSFYGSKIISEGGMLPMESNEEQQFQTIDGGLSFRSYFE